MLPTKKRKPQRSAHLGVTTLIGIPKIGKSTFGSEMPEPLFCAFEDGCRHLEVFITPEDGNLEYSWDRFLADLRKLRDMKKAGKCPYETIVIDTIDLALNECRRAVLEKYSAQHESDLPFGKGWAMVQWEFSRVLSAIKRLGLGVLLVTHQEEKEIESFDGKKYSKGTTTLPKAGRAIVIGLSDSILYATMERCPVTGKWRRVIKTKPGRDYEAGGRYPRGGEGIPPTIPLSYECWRRAFEEGLTAEQLEKEFDFPTQRKAEGSERSPPPETDSEDAPPPDELAGDAFGEDEAENNPDLEYGKRLASMESEELRSEWKAISDRMKYEGEKPKTLSEAREMLLAWFQDDL